MSFKIFPYVELLTRPHKWTGQLELVQGGQAMDVREGILKWKCYKKIF